MKANILLIAAFIMALSVNGCAANNAKGGNESIYDRPGMEISKTASQMADTLCETFKHDLEAKARSDHSEFKNFPIVGVTSFVDTDTYENAGHLGRSLGEFFIHELDRRGIPVAEFKTTGSLSITEDGEDIFSRDYKKLKGQAKFRHLLAGTITRNEYGVVLSGRIIDMQSSQVRGSATGFIPYKYLPYCYRTREKNCSFEGSISYSTYIPSSKNINSGTAVSSSGNVTDTVTSVHATVSDYSTYVSTVKSNGNMREDAAARTAREKLEHDPLFNEKYYPQGAKTSPTSNGNYEQFIHDKGSMRGHSSVIYPADSYLYGGHLVRDVHDQSQYQRIEDN